MSSLGLAAHHNNSQNLRISPHGMATLSPQHMGAPPNMRLTPPHQQQHPQQPPPLHGSQGPPTVPPPQNLSINMQRQQHSPSTGNSIQQLATGLPRSPPQNLSMSPSQCVRSSPPVGIRLASSSPQSIGSSPDKHVGGKLGESLDIVTVSDGAATKEIALNMTMNNSDMRTNSIATLRIKAKEHLESLNKGLTMV